MIIEEKIDLANLPLLNGGGFVVSKRKVHIIIPTYNHWEMTHNLLWQLSRKEKENIDTVLVLNDGSIDGGETESGLKWWEEHKVLPVSIINLPFNVGFLRVANIGLLSFQENNPEDIVILFSNDVLVNGEFISQICDIIDGNSSSLIGGILYSHDTGWNKFGEKLFPYLEGWLLATTVQNWVKLDYFDGRYIPSDFEDVDLSTTALSLGMELVPLNNVGLVHKGAATIGYNETRLANTKKNQKLFGEKWIGKNSKTD
jgi:GT2 family glycosyltransferase